MRTAKGGPSARAAVILGVIPPAVTRPNISRLAGLTEVFLDDPITRDELRHDPRFAGAAILQQPFAGNPFPLTDDQWAAIVDHRHSSAPTEKDTAVP